MKRLLSIVALLCICAPVFAQKYGYGWPMADQSISLSSTYGELRHNHFHAGLDWRTGGRSGEPLHAIKEGYVCRLSVSPVGYGNAVYIQHPDGTMSVYGHMQSFRKDIAERVREEQYKNKSFKVVFYPRPDEFPVAKGDLIGLSGNSGSSGGPHLHMEIRRDGDNLPVNYLSDGTYPIKDTKPPVISRVGFYAFEDSSAIPVVRRLNMIGSPEKYKGTVTVSEHFYVAIDATDRLDGATGKMAVERYRVYLDSEKVFDFKVGDVPYSDGRYFACLVQQGERGGDLLKTWCPPNNGLLYKIEAPNDGIITLYDNDVHTLKIVVSDCFGNSASCSLPVRRDTSVKVFEPADTVGLFAALWYVPNVFSKDGVTLALEPASLNASTYLKCVKNGSAAPSEGIYSDIWSLGDESIHLQKQAKVKFSLKGIPSDVRDRLYVAKVADSGSRSFAGNERSGETIVGRGGLGTYLVALDTIAPRLIPRVTEGKELPSGGRFYVEAADYDSGVESFDVQMDGEWILSQYYGGRIYVYPDESHRTRRSHTVLVSATDHCGNSSSVEFEVIY